MKHSLIQESLDKVYRLFEDSKVSVTLGDVVSVSQDKALSEQQAQAIKEVVVSMPTWRQGPYNLFDYQIDSEWQSQIKWQRIIPHLGDLANKALADIGCSNGYFMFRMLEHNPASIVGFDPFQICHYQYTLINHFIKSDQINYLRKGVEEISTFPNAFDLVFFMGVLYHRKDPVQTLIEIRSALKAGGEMILETMILPEETSEPIEITDRYSKMKNVYFLTGVTGLISWLEQAGFSNCKILSVSQTSSIEQRKTDFAPYESLAEFLDQDNPHLTVEGLAAPRRILLKVYA